MEKTAMQKHLEWLKGRMVITPEMESQLLEEEKQQIIDAYNEGDANGANRIYYHDNRDDVSAEQYYNKTFSN